jgi:hypothetical protein
MPPSERGSKRTARPRRSLRSREVWIWPVQSFFVDYVRTSGSYFTATVYNSNAGYMIVTDFRGGR